MLVLFCVRRRSQPRSGNLCASAGADRRSARGKADAHSRGPIALGTVKSRSTEISEPWLQTSVSFHFVVSLHQFSLGPLLARIGELGVE